MRHSSGWVTTPRRKSPGMASGMTPAGIAEDFPELTGHPMRHVNGSHELAKIKKPTITPFTLG
ncbi:MAG: hypothetical protein ACOYMG_28830 [Candidatus Methylumidiphilus sp.]